MNSRTQQTKRMLGKVKKIIVMNNGADCFICNKDGHELAHLFVKNKMKTCFDVAKDGNNHILCSDCHRRDHNGELEVSYEDTYIKKFGQDKLDALRARSNEIPSSASWFMCNKEHELDEQLRGSIDRWRNRGISECEREAIGERWDSDNRCEEEGDGDI